LFGGSMLTTRGPVESSFTLGAGKLSTVPFGTLTVCCAPRVASSGP
jgi:hypothetical protein